MAGSSSEDSALWPKQKLKVLSKTKIYTSLQTCKVWFIQTPRTQHSRYWKTNSSRFCWSQLLDKVRCVFFLHNPAQHLQTKIRQVRISLLLPIERFADHQEPPERIRQWGGSPRFPECISGWHESTSIQSSKSSRVDAARLERNQNERLVPRQPSEGNLLLG